MCCSAPVSGHLVAQVLPVLGSSLSFLIKCAHVLLQICSVRVAVSDCSKAGGRNKALDLIEGTLA